MSTTPIALITGGSRGLGRNGALKLAEKGTDVIITYHTNREAADQVVAAIRQLGRRAAALPLDAGNIRSFDGFVTQVRAALAGTFGAERFNYLVNNAGTGLYVPFTDATEEQFDQQLNLHFKGVFFLTQKLLPLMADGGRILNISSGLARFSFPGSSVYASMKGAIEVLTRYLAKELGPRGISANVLAPGAIETDFGGGRTRDNPDINRVVAAQTALGRAGLPDDIGPVIAALLAPENRWINGQRIEASGGMVL
jgi:NAD(P)-dependent dehydrogenase (short-subunit alcohol dehydrogenase family)